MLEGFLLVSRLEVNVGQGVHLIHNDIDVVTANTCALYSDMLSFICTCDGFELSAFYFTLLGLKMRGNKCNSARVANENNLVSELFWLNVQMENATIWVNN